jgi:hypothetical protein
VQRNIGRRENACERSNISLTHRFTTTIARRGRAREPRAGTDSRCPPKKPVPPAIGAGGRVQFGACDSCALFRAVLPLAYVQCAAARRHGTLYRTSAQSGEQHARKWHVRQVPRPCNGTTILQERSRSAMDRPFRFSDNKTSRVPLPEQSAFFAWRVDRQTALLR